MAEEYDNEQQRAIYDNEPAGGQFHGDGQQRAIYDNEQQRAISREPAGGQFDVIVIGAGPAGATAAMYLAKAGVNVLLVDKAEFPRDKICGDAQGRKAAKIMQELGIHNDYLELPGQKIYGLTLSSPNGTAINLDVEHDRSMPAPGYTHKREIFDNFLYESAKKVCKTRVFEANDLIVEDGCVRGVAGINERKEEEVIMCRLVLGADGGNSMVARKFSLNTNPPDDFIVAVRAYYRNVAETTDRIEIHLVKNLIPGYFWIFPLPGNETNIGLGMIVKDKNRKGVNLKEALLKEIKENPLFAGRFRNAEMLDEVRGWNLPVASFHRKCYGNGFLLLGDAASLIDPLSGEGVGNAMLSGKIAAKIAVEALQKNDFSEKFLKAYDKELWQEIGDEIKTNTRLQRLGKRFPFLIDKLVEKAARDTAFRKRVEEHLPYSGKRCEIGKLSFLKFLGYRGSREEPTEEEIVQGLE